MTHEETRSGARAAVAVVLLAIAAWGARSFDTKPSRHPVAPSAAPRAVPAADANSRDAVDDDADADPLALSPAVPLHPALRPSSSQAPVAPVASAPPVVPLSAAEGEQEITLLEKAQAALVSDPERALALADEDARRFSQGPMREQAEVIAIDALQRLGRRPLAEARARKFRAAYPRSTHLGWVESILARAL